MAKYYEWNKITENKTRMEFNDASNAFDKTEKRLKCGYGNPKKTDIRRHPHGITN